MPDAGHTFSGFLRLHYIIFNCNNVSKNICMCCYVFVTVNTDRKFSSYTIAKESKYHSMKGNTVDVAHSKMRFTVQIF